MRTTLDLPDVLMRDVAGRAAKEGRSLKAIMSEIVSLGLHRKAGTQEPWVCPSYSLGGPKSDYTKAWAPVEALEAEAVAEKLERRK